MVQSSMQDYIHINLETKKKIFLNMTAREETIRRKNND